MQSASPQQKHALQQGVALITVLLVVAMATTAAVAMASRQQIDIRRTENTLFQGQALQYALGVEHMAKQILAEDRRNNAVDHTQEDWSQLLPPTTVEGGYVNGYLEDLQGRFNLNSLQQSGDPGKLAVDRFRRLLQNLGLDENKVNVILDWLDADVDARFPEGAEDVYYLGLEQPYRSADRLMQSPSELLLLKDFTDDDYEQLLPHVCALPQATPINVNTATLEVLLSLGNDLSSGDVEAIIKDRENKSYDTVEKFLNEPAFAGKNIPTDGLSVNSNYFLLHAEAGIGHLRQTLASLFERDDKGLITTLMRSGGEI